MSSTDAIQFERFAGESARQFHAFCHYRDLAPTMRSLDRAWREHHEKCLHQLQPVTRRRPPSWGNASARWGWVERASAYDRFTNRQKRAALEAEQIECAKRHARTLQAATSCLSISLRLALETAANAAGMETLRSAALANVFGLRTTVAEARLAASALPALILAERAVLGMGPDYDVHETPKVDPVAARILTDPAAMELAIELLDRVAGPLPEEPPRLLAAKDRGDVWE